MLIDPVELRQWMGPRGFVVTELDADVRVGGRFRYRMRKAGELDERPMKEAAEWYLTQGGGIQLVLDKERAGKSLVTVGISAIDELVRDLKSRGIDARTSDASGAFRLAQVRDVDGNQLTFAQRVIRADR